MVMFHAIKRTSKHCIGKVSRTLEGCNSHRKRLPDAEMTASPCDFLAGTDETRGDSADGALAGAGGGSDVQVDATSQVEDAINRSGNESYELIPGIVKSRLGTLSAGRGD